MTPEIEMIEIVKKFGDLLANDHVNLSIEKGEIRALVGENGAGKTTLMRVLFGLYRPNAGIIRIRGKDVNFASPHDAIAHQLGMVHQHFMLFEDLTVTENIIYGKEPHRWGFVDQKTASREVKALAERYGFKIEPDVRLSTLSVGEKQRIEILKTLYRGANVIILDEPTAVLTPQERDDLFKVLRSLSDQGKTIILITHKLQEVMEISQLATVLRRGRLVGTVETAHATIQELACMMVGREVFLRVEKPPCEAQEPILQVQGLTLKNKHGLKALDSVSFDVRAGEIVGIAGVAGNGQGELVDTLVGFSQPDEGRITLNGRDISRESILKRREYGFAYIPEDRYQRGLAITESITENLVMGFQRTPEISHRGITNPRSTRRWAGRILQQYDVRLTNPDEPASNLSGGNLQKVILAREFSQPSRFILADQPTRGVDIGATEFIYQQLVARRNRGDGVLFISADLTEIMSISDRILVMFAGKIVASIPADQAREEQLGLLMAGSQAADPHPLSATL
jgi:general nucleoside transport system ATP-binding protein